MHGGGGVSPSSTLGVFFSLLKHENEFFDSPWYELQSDASRINISDAPPIVCMCMNVRNR